MDDDLDLEKRLNRKADFKYPDIYVQTQIRLLRVSFDEITQEVNYSLEIFDLAEVPFTMYNALSYTWGQAYSLDDVQEIQISNQPFFVRRNLFDYFAALTEREEYGLFYIDAICINQLDHYERQCQVQYMSLIYSSANHVIAWLGLPDTSEARNIEALSEAKGDCTSWTMAQWEGFRYLSYRPFWSRLWIVQEVLLASDMIIWCGSFTFPLSLFGGPTASNLTFETKISNSGRPHNVASPMARLKSPAAEIVTHRLRFVPIPLRERDPLAQGTEVGTMDEMIKELKGVKTEVVAYQSHVADLLHVAIHKFGMLQCSDPRDKLYGFLGILNEKSRAKVLVDYEKDVSYAYYQALKIGFQEICLERGGVIYSQSDADASGSYLAYYCDVRDSFQMSDSESLNILREVLRELDFKSWVEEAYSEAQVEQQFVWKDDVVGVNPDFGGLLEIAGETELGQEHPDSPLFRFHARQRMFLKRVFSWLRGLSKRRKVRA